MAASPAPTSLNSRHACMALMLLGALSIGTFAVHKLRSRGNELIIGGQPIELTRKPRGDTRSYQVSVLPNGLQMVNVRDHSATLSAVGVAVQAGSYDDTESFPGLAHFCEHMLFLGTEKFPDPSGFDQFISKNGGANNAYTSDEKTVYFAQFSSSAAVEGVSRLADFFRAPLFNEKFVSKEVHAIDSEHAKNVQDPTRRIFETMNALANPKSPVSKFHTGDHKTLFDLPKKRGENPVDALKVYYQQHYCPSKMRLVTIGPEPLEEQLKTAGAAFGQISEGSKECQMPLRSWATPTPWPADRMGKWVDIVGTNPQPQLWLFFPLPDISKAYASQPMAYISWVLQYAGENSLVQVLKDQLGLVASISVMNDGSSAGMSVILMATLTEAGQKTPAAVLDVLYSYLSLLLSRGVDEKLYQSLSDVAQLEWDWSEQTDLLKTVSGLAETMTRLPSQDLLTGDSLIDRPNATLVSSLLKRLTPDNMNVGFVDPALAEKETKWQELPHYGVQYQSQDLAKALPGAQERWNKWLSTPNEKLLEEQLRKALGQKEGAASPLPVPPKAIEDVITDIPIDNMVAEASDAGPSAVIFGPRPEKIDYTAPVEGKKSDVLSTLAIGASAPEVYYRKGWVTKSPKAQLSLVFRPLKEPQEPEGTAIDLVRLSIFKNLLMEEMAPKMVDLESTGLSYSIDASHGGMSLSFTGFTPALPNLIQKVVNEVRKGVNVTDVSRFNRAMALAKENLETYSDMPVTYAIGDRNLLLTRGGYSREETLSALAKVTAKSSASALDDVLLKRPLQLTSLAMGNIAESDAKTALRIVDKGISTPTNSAAGAKGAVERVAPVVKLVRPVELRKQNPRAGDPNDAVVVSFVSGVADVGSRVVLGLLGKILAPIAYEELRTNMQLGYVVNAGAVQLSNVQLLSVIVQGKAMKADKMEAAVERVYTKLMPARLANLTQADFESYKSSFSQSLFQAPLGFTGEVGHFMSPVMTDSTCFGLQDEMLRYMNESLGNKQALIEAYEKLVTPVEGSRKRMAVKYFAVKEGDKDGQHIPKRPDLSEAEDIWAKEGIEDQARERLRTEYGHTLLLDKADSSSRETILKEGGYFPTQLICKLSTPSKAPLVLPKLTKPSGIADPDVPKEISPLGSSIANSRAAGGTAFVHGQAVVSSSSPRLRKAKQSPSLLEDDAKKPSLTTKAIVFFQKREHSALESR